jgi:hypothetical protein
LLAAVAVPTTATELTIELLAETSLPGDLEVDGTPVGGLSGLTYDPGCDLFYSISDDRGSLAPPRFYSLKFQFDGDGVAARMLAATLLRDVRPGSTPSNSSSMGTALRQGCSQQPCSATQTVRRSRAVTSIPRPLP